MNEMSDSESKCSRCGRDANEYQQRPHTLPQGAVLNNRYLVGGVIGEGGFGITYIGLDTLLQFRVAIKEFFPNGMVNRNNTVSNDVLSISTESAKELFSKSRENFLREARTLAKFTNEAGIVAVRDFFEENHTVYIVMEYLDGITLKTYLSQVGRISANNTVCLLMPVITSLKKIHEKNLIHRDISPDNIMLCGEQVKLLDFGAARDFADEKSLSVMLKHGYAPMEQYRRHGTQGAWTDIYAICATMYKCVTGQIPPDAPDRVFDDDIKKPSELGIETEPEFEKVLMHGLAIRPEDRIQSIDELLSELDAVPGIDIDTPAQTAAAPVVSEAPAKTTTTATQTDDGRLSEYVPHMVDEPEKKPAPAPAPPPEKKSKKGLVIALAAILGVAVIGGGIAAAVLLGGNASQEEGSSQVQSTSQPDESSESPSGDGSSDIVSDDSSDESSDGTSDPSAESSDESSEESSEDVSDTESSEEDFSSTIKYPNVDDYFTFEDGILTMDYSLFGMELDEVTRIFQSRGDVFRTNNHPVYGSLYKILLIPLDRPTNQGMDIATIDLYFLDDKLVIAAHEQVQEYDTELVEKATKRFGKPNHSDEDSANWFTGEEGISYETYMMDYDSYITFVQRYRSDAAAVG